MHMLLLLYCVIVIFQPSLINGLVCYCTPGFIYQQDVNPCEQENNTSYYTRVCGSGGVCHVFRDQDSNRIVQHCVYSTVYLLGCSAQLNYNTIIDGGNSLCCAQDYCNSVKLFLEFIANLSATTTNNVLQVTSSTTSYNVGQVTSSTSKLTSTTNCIPTASPTAPDVQNQPQESSTIILLICFAIVVVVSVVVITILTILSVKRRRTVPHKMLIPNITSNHLQIC